MTLFSLCGVAFICVIAAMIIKENGAKSYAPILLCITLILISVYVVKNIGQAFNDLSVITVQKIQTPYFELVLKTFGISFVCEISSDTLRDLGADTLGKWIETAGKSEIVLLSVPLLSELIEKAMSFV